ncbi:MAG: AAA family ATPase [Micromonosporaceae bacterium]|nr:AAA family ATPase [Micromonosporaceae bacterium]
MTSCRHGWSPAGDAPVLIVGAAASLGREVGVPVPSGRHPAASGPAAPEAAAPATGTLGPTTAAGPAFVGRDDELGAVLRALADPPALVLIEGEAGIGKTRLVREALGSPALRDRTVPIAGCPPVKEPFPLGAVVDGLRRLRPRVGDLGLSPLGGALRPLFPEWAGQLPPALEGLDDPVGTRHRLLRALTELVERLGVDLLVIEDAHWADVSTLEWLLTLSAVGDPGLSVVVTYRPTDVPEESLLLRLTSRPVPGMSQARVELGPLSRAQSQRMVGELLGAQGVSEEFAGFMYERTDGVPLAIEETVRLLRDRDDIAHRDGIWTRRVLAELQVPPTLRDSVLERLARLTPPARQVLEVAAVVAEPVDEPTLAAVGGLAEATGRAGLAAALASGLLQETSPGRFAIRHVFDAQAVSGAIPVSDRRRLHQRTAQVLERLDPPPVVRLAGHFREAGDLEQWCRYAEAAADLAWEAGDDRTAVVTLLDLLDQIEHPFGRRVRLVRKLFDAAFFGAAALGDLAYRVADALRAVLDTDGLRQPERGEFRLHLARMLWTVGEGLAAAEQMEAAIPDLGDRPNLAIHAMNNIAMAVVPDWPAARHRWWLSRATELAERSGSPADQQAVAWARATGLLLLGDEAGWTAARELPQVASGARELRILNKRRLNVAEATLPWGRYDETRRQVDAVVGYVESSGYQRRVSKARLVRNYLDWYTGQWRDLATAAADVAAAEESEPLEKLRARQLMGLLDLAAGARARAERQLRAVASEYARLNHVQAEELAVPAALGRLCLADGAVDEALQVTTPAIEMITRKDVWLWATDIAPVRLDALVAGGRLGDAEQLVSQFAAGLADRAAPAPAAALDTCRAILAGARGDPAAAAERFVAAAAAWAALPRPYDQLLTLERQGCCLLAAGRTDPALTVLADAQQRLSELGARWDADRLAQRLRQHGVTVARTWRGGRRGYGDQLSPRELEVVRLVSKGMTSQEVGEAVFLSPRTVDQHLRNAMRKLDVRSRTALATAVAETNALSTDDHEQRRPR